MKKILELCLLAAAYSTSSHAQAVEGFGAVTGTVREGPGDGLPDATVVIYNDALGLRRTMTTTTEGLFSAPALVPSAGYALKVTCKGFADWETKNIQVSLGQTLNFRIEMQGRTAASHVQTSAPLEPLDESNTAVSSTVTQPQIDSLPSSGRLLDNFVLLAPGVTQDGASGVLVFRGEPSTNSFLTDGIGATNTYYYQKPSIAPQVSPDATAELQVLSAAAPAEFGHTMDGSVNAVTRSGSNSYHGAAYGYFNDQSFNAADRFAPAFNPGGYTHQGGIDAGGPVVHGKLFWFLNGEILDARSDGLNRIANPLIAAQSGASVLTSSCASPATAAQCVSAISFINAQMDRVVPRSITSPMGLAKVDYRPADSNSFTFEADAMHRHSPNGTETDTVTGNGGLLGYNGTYTEETRFAKAGWTSAPAGNAVNELRAGWFKDRFSDYEDPSLLPSTGAIAINVAGTPVGGNPAYPMALSEQHEQLVDNLTVSSNAHSIKFGADYSKTEDWTEQVFNRFGAYDYSSLTAFAQDFSGNTLQRKNYTDFNQGFGIPVIDLRTPVISAYAQDTWRPLRRLTVNFGVHWEKSLLPKPTESNSTYYETASISSPNTDFSPRVGAAYLLDSHTVVRFGLGTYFQPFTGQLIDQLFTGNGIYQAAITETPAQAGALVFPKVFASPSSILNGMQNIVYSASKFRNPYTEQVTVGIERNLAKDTSLALSYADTRGVKLWTESDQNLAASTITKTYTVDDASGNPVNTFTTPIFTAKTDTAHAHVYLVNNEGLSRYHALAVQFRKRMSHGLAVQASYTWSHAIDDVSGSPVLGFLALTTNPGDYRTDQGDSAFDQRHRFTANWTWQPTVTRGHSPAERYLLNGWRISAIATLASGLPETPIVLINGQQFSGVAMAYTSSLNGSGGWQRAPFENVNSLLTGKEYDVDARITRTVPFTERVQGMLIFEAFNAFNTQYNTGVNTIAYTATSGVLKPVADVGVGNAASGYPYGANARRAQVAFRVTF